MPLWIPITVAAALCQNIRTTMQQKIRGILSVDGANFVRYLYGAPLALGMLAFLVFGTGRHVPHITWTFLLLVTIAGVAQIVATSLMIHAFSLRNYAVGTVYSKTETVWVALFATYISHEPLHLLAWMGILVCLGGVAILSVRGSFANIRTVRDDIPAASRCEALLVQASPLRVPAVGNEWTEIWRGSRPGDRNELFIVYRKL